MSVPKSEKEYEYEQLKKNIDQILKKNLKVLVMLELSIKALLSKAPASLSDGLSEKKELEANLKTISMAKSFLNYMIPRNFQQQPITLQEENQYKHLGKIEIHNKIRLDEINKIDKTIKTFNETYNLTAIEQKVHANMISFEKIIESTRGRRASPPPLPATSTVAAVSPQRPPSLPPIPVGPSTPKAAPASPKASSVTSSPSKATISGLTPLPAKPPVSPSVAKAPTQPASASVINPLPIPPAMPASTRTSATMMAPLPQTPLSTPRKSTVAPAASAAPAESQAPGVPAVPPLAVASAEPTAPQAPTAPDDVPTDLPKPTAFKESSKPIAANAPNMDTATDKSPKSQSAVPKGNALISQTELDLMKNALTDKFKNVKAKDVANDNTMSATATPKAQQKKFVIPGASKSKQVASEPSTPTNTPKPVSVATQSQSAPSSPTYAKPQQQKSIPEKIVQPAPTSVGTSSIPTRTPATSAAPQKPTSTPTAPIAPPAPAELPSTTLERPLLTKIENKRPAPLNTQKGNAQIGLVDAINKGITLKKVEPSAAKPAAKKDDSTPASPTSSDSESPSSPLSFLFRMQGQTAAVANQKSKTSNDQNDEPWDENEPSTPPNDDEPSTSPKR